MASFNLIWAKAKNCENHNFIKEMMKLIAPNLAFPSTLLCCAAALASYLPEYYSPS
jgi:hypothetical protein